MLRNTLSDTDNKGDLGQESLLDTGSSHRGARDRLVYIEKKGVE